MVAGSGPDPGTDKTKRLYDGKLDSWPAAKIKIKSYLFKLGLWDVVQDGPSDRAETPVHAHAGPLPGEPEGEYFYSLRDTDINGPCSGKTILEVVNPRGPWLPIPSTSTTRPSRTMTGSRGAPASSTR